MINKKLEDIIPEDLQNLIVNGVSESKTIEYKSELPLNTGDAKKEFLADVSSFANTSGGDIFYGIVEDKGVPVEIKGLTIENQDDEILRLENLIRDGLVPRIQADLCFVPLENLKQILVIRVKKSLSNPHRVVFQGHDKFYARNSKGKYPLDTFELKTAFNLSDTIANKIANFKASRISEIESGQTPLPFYEGGKTVLHLIPLESIGTTRFDINKIDFTGIMPLGNDGCNPLINFDGKLFYTPGRASKSCAYLQFYRNGTIETVSTLTYHSEEKFIPSQSFEKVLINTLTTYLNFYKRIECGLPIILYLTLIDIKGYHMALPPNYIDNGRTLDRNILPLPEVLIESYDAKPGKILKPLFDLIWNAFGFPKTIYLDDEGNWIQYAA